MAPAYDEPHCGRCGGALPGERWCACGGLSTAYAPEARAVRADFPHCGSCGTQLDEGYSCRCGGVPVYAVRRAEPAPGDPGWYERHEGELLELARRGGETRGTDWTSAMAALRRRWLPGYPDPL